MSARRGTPLYRVITEDLRARIGEMEGGDRLPTETDLATDYGTTRMTVRKAYEALIVDGLVEVQPTVGYFVRGVHARTVPLSRPVEGATLPVPPWTPADGFALTTVSTAQAGRKVGGLILGEVLDLRGSRDTAGCRSTLCHTGNRPTYLLDVHMPFKHVKNAAFMDERAAYDPQAELTAAGWRLTGFRDRLVTRHPDAAERDRLELPTVSQVAELTRLECYVRGDAAPAGLVLSRWVSDAAGAVFEHDVRA